MGICNSVGKGSDKNSYKNVLIQNNTISESKTRTETQPLESDKKIDEQGRTNRSLKQTNTLESLDKETKKKKSEGELNNKKISFEGIGLVGFEENRMQTLIDKKKSHSKSFREEFNMCISNRTLITEMEGTPTKKYKIISTIGEGAYGTVFLALNVETRTQVAMKKIDKEKEKIIDDLELKNEIDILTKLNHPNIMKIFEFYDTQTNYFIISEYCQKKELFHYFKSQFTENQLAVLFYQVFSGLVYLHENNIIHRDLKLANILISEIEKDKKTNEEYFVIKIIDFGTAKMFNKNKSEKSIVGSSYYMAPEVIKQKYNEKCDTWSIGIIIYMLIVGKPPFDGNTDEEIMGAIEQGFYNGNHRKLLSSSKEIQDLIRKLLCKNIHNRLSAKEALNHPWFKVYNGRRLFSNFEINEVMPYINNLMNYKLQSKFQQFVLAFLVHNISIPDEKYIMKLFRHFNLKGDCKLSREELFNGICAFKDKEEVKSKIEDIFLLLDGDNNGYIEYGEFLRACVDKKEILSDANLQYAFQYFDKKKKRRISISNLIDILASNNNKYEEVFKNTIKEADQNNDGEIEFEEYKQYMLNLI